MDFLCDVQRDSHNGARVLPHSHPPRAAGRSPRGRHIAPKASDPVIPSPPKYPLRQDTWGPIAEGPTASPWPGLVGLKQDKQGGLVVAMQELQVDDVEQLLIQSPHVDDVAGQEAGPLPTDQRCRQEEVIGQKLRALGSSKPQPAQPSTHPSPMSPSCSSARLSLRKGRTTSLVP